MSDVTQESPDMSVLCNTAVLMEYAAGSDEFSDPDPELAGLRDELAAKAPEAHAKCTGVHEESGQPCLCPCHPNATVAS